MRMLYLLGVDGSGKTTLAQNLTEELEARGHRAYRFYARHVPILLLPLKVLARQSLLRGTDQFTDYRTYAAQKRNSARRFRLGAWLYAAVWIVDYVMLTWIRLLVTRRPAEYVIVDRYYIDVAVNISETLGLDHDKMRALARFLGRFFISPDLPIYIDIPEEVAYERKDDIPAPEYLRERRRRYEALADSEGFVVLDGVAAPHELVGTVLEAIGVQHA